MQRIPFHRPTIDETDIPGVVEVLRSGWITTGARAKEFEKRFAAELGDAPGGVLQALATNSGTAALHLALEACGVGPGDLVIVPVMTFTASAEVVRYLGADPLFVDVDDHDLNLRADTIRDRVAALPESERARVRAVMAVHYAGLPCDMPALEELCRERGWALIDDAAHALPTQIGGRAVGTWGDATAFSFYATKTLCTGEGGMVVTRDPDRAARMRVMRLHGIDRDAFDRYRSDTPSWAYEIVAPGYKYNMGDIAAALGLSQLERLHEFRAARASIAGRYSAAFGQEPGLHVPPDAPERASHSWHLYSLRVEAGRATRDRAIEELAAGGIGTSVHFIPLHRHPYWIERCNLAPEDFPVADAAWEQQISLPIFPGMTDEEVTRVINAVLQTLRRA